ncbi:MAG: superoxide dismutase [Caulobacteraceae bacterium]|nr:superoxide dismutase [Caulobacteraceae bacterium]
MFKLPDLPYAYDALSPVISDATMHLHHDKHHARYVTVLNQALEESGAKPADLESVVREAVAKGDKKLINNGGQAWNHAFFWEAMAGSASTPTGALAAAIDKAFGDFEAFKAAFVKEGVGHFGSGWVWLVAHGETLSIKSSHDGETLLPDTAATPILVCDLWEHAYYLDHKNDREGFLKQWIATLANWGFAEAQYAAATGTGKAYAYPAPTA